MSTARLAPMPEADLDAWRASRAASGAPLPDPTAGAVSEALSLTVDGVVVGGALLELVDDAAGHHCEVRVLQTTLPRDAGVAWQAVARALEDHARRRRASTLTAAVAPELVGAFGDAGFRATMTSVGKRLGSAPTELQDDRRVDVRPMTADERTRFVADVGVQLRAGMARAGVVGEDGAGLAALDERLERLLQDPPPDNEVLLTGTVDGVPVGRAWMTLVDRDGELDLDGNTLDLFPEHRGRRLTPSFVGALRRHAAGRGVRDVRLRVYAHDTGARRTYLDAGAAIHEVHLRKDLLAPATETPGRLG